MPILARFKNCRNSKVSTLGASSPTKITSSGLQRSKKCSASNRANFTPQPWPANPLLVPRRRASRRAGPSLPILLLLLILFLLLLLLLLLLLRLLLLPVAAEVSPPNRFPRRSL